MSVLRLLPLRRSISSSAPRLQREFGEHKETSEQGYSAGSDEVASSDGAFNKESNPESSSKQISKETGADMSRSAANKDTSKQMDETPEGPGETEKGQ